MKRLGRIAGACALAFGLGLLTAGGASAQTQNVARATLGNGLQVIVVHDPLAPVVTSVMTYRSGSNEQEYPGQAHALEHMMFRGTKDVSSAQIYEIGQLLGGDYNAETKSTSTQYYFTIPSQYLDVALRLESDRARNLLLTQKGWEAERGAIEQEVTMDESDPIDKLERRTILPAIFAGTPYAKDGLGTAASFNHVIDAKALRRYYKTWYHPNNAVLVVAGNIEPSYVLSEVKKYFAAIPAAPLPKLPAVTPRALKAATYHVTTDYPATVVALAFRSPGWSDKDYAAMQVLESVLDNQRAALYGLVAQGQAFAAEVANIQSNPHATATFLYGVIPAASNPSSFAAQLQSVVAGYQKTGVPADLVEVAKRRAEASKEYASNSIEDLALSWTTAVGEMGLKSPDEQIAQIQAVSVDDVNRVLRKYIVPQHLITVLAVPSNTGRVNSGGREAKENNAVPPSKPEPLPAWAQAAFAHVRVPAKTIAPVAMTLSNGMHLIVQPEHVSHTITVRGSVSTNEAIEAPAGKQGVEDVLNALFPFGTAQYDRLQLRQQLDAIAAEMDAGTSFSLDVRTANFDRGVQLLAQDELHPALPAAAFEIEKQQETAGLAGQEKTPQYLSDLALARALYPEGDPESVVATSQTSSSLTLDDVKNYYAKAFRPDMTSVVVIGDITPEAAKATFEKYFGDWKAEGAKPEVALPAVPRNAAKNVQVPDPSRVQATVQLAQVMPLKRSDPQWAQVQVGNAVFGGNGAFGTLLMDDLRTRSGLVYYAYSRLSSHINRSTFTIGYGSDPGKVVAAQNLALNDLRAMENGTIDAARLQRSKTMLISDIPLREQSFDGVANELLMYDNQHLPLDQALVDAGRELDATAQSVQQALKTWIEPNGFVRVILGPGPK